MYIWLRLTLISLCCPDLSKAKATTAQKNINNKVIRHLGTQMSSAFYKKESMTEDTKHALTAFDSSLDRAGTAKKG
jgi:hypothetical protein